MTTDGKKLPREMVAAMQDDWAGGLSYVEAMKAKLKEEESPSKEMKRRQSPVVRSELKGESLELYDRIVESRGKVGAKAGFSATREDGSLAGPWNAMVTASPAIGKAAEALANACRQANSVPPVLYECGILCIAASRRCNFEFYAHELIARQKGVADETIAAIKMLVDPKDLPGSEAQRAIYKYALELDRTHRVSDETHAAALKALDNDETQLADFVFTIGLYSQVAFVLNAYQVPLPPGKPHPFPPN